MERIGFLINKLKEQYEQAANQDSMFVTLQMLYRELMPKLDADLFAGKISVTIPGLMDMTFLEKTTEQKPIQELPANNLEKQTANTVEKKQEIKQLVVNEHVKAPKNVDNTPPQDLKPVEKPQVFITEAPKNPFIIAAPKTEPPVIKAEPALVEKPTEKQETPPKPIIPDEQNTRYMPKELKPIEPPIVVTAPTIPPSTLNDAPPPPIVEPPVTATVVPPRGVHESLHLDAQPSLNEKVEKRQPELFHVLKAEPLKDLKKAISINERFQYINHLFMKDESMYDRSLKTINNFNVFSEAHFWIRKELATKLGWNDDDEVVQQFMNLVERRFL